MLEPSEEKAILMMRGAASTMEKHHQVQVLDEALEASVRLSHRYIPARQLPDKSVSLLDTACARVAISQSAVPASVDDCRKRIDALENELAIIGREKEVGVDTTEREVAANEKLTAEQAVLEKLDGRWNTEKELVSQILEIRSQLRSKTNKVEGTDSELEASADEEAETTSIESNEELEADTAEATIDREALLNKLKLLQDDLNERQGEDPLILSSVDETAVGSVVQDWTGIPVGRMVKNEIETVLNLPEISEETYHRPGSRPADGRPAHPDLPRQPRQPQQTHRRLHVCRYLRRRQDRDCTGPGPRPSTAANRTLSPST